MSDALVKKGDPRETEKKLAELRQKVASKVDRWANAVKISMSIPDKIVRLEGEQWEEDGKRWEMKDGIKRSISALNHARMPWWCPKCSKPMNHKFDRKFYYIRGWCFNCNVDFEGQMRIDGTYEAFEKRLMWENEKALLRDKLQEYRDYIENFTPPTMVFEDGRYEQLAPISAFVELFESIEKDGELLAARLEAMNREEQHELDAQSNRETGDELSTKAV